jgi:hypothetical protein
MSDPDVSGPSVNPVVLPLIVGAAGADAPLAIPACETIKRSPAAYPRALRVEALVTVADVVDPHMFVGARAVITLNSHR